MTAGAAVAAVAAAVAWGALPHRSGTAASPEQIALGERVLQRFCLSCHSLEDPAWNPLRQRLAAADWGTADAAYASIGRLDRISPGMTLRFEGTEEERRALAAVLAGLAASNR